MNAQISQNAPGPLPEDQSPPLDPNELPYPGYAREKAAIDAKVAAAARMRGEPLPGALREAFAGEPRRLHGFTFQPVNAWLIAILRRIGSPIVDIVKIYRAHGEALAEAHKITDKKEREAEVKRIHDLILDEQRKLEPAPEAAMETVFAFVIEVEKCQELLDRNRNYFTTSARKLLGVLHPNVLADLEKACGEHFAASFSTGLNISAVQKDDGGGTVFTQPPAMTESAGGSKSSAL